MNIFEKMILKIQYGWIYHIKDYFVAREYKRKYPDYEDNSYNCGSLQHIWGVCSGDYLGSECHLYSMNDIDITYDRDTKLYSLGIETIYIFQGNSKENECRYLKGLLNKFTEYMDNNNLQKDFDIRLSLRSFGLKMEAETIGELYINFKIYVEGYCKVYEQENNISTTSQVMEALLDNPDLSEPFITEILQAKGTGSEPFILPAKPIRPANEIIKENFSLFPTKFKCPVCNKKFDDEYFALICCDDEM